jgi:hypothetical protein
MSMEGRDEEGGIVVKGIIAGDGEEEVALDVFVLGAPDFFSAFVDNGVLVRVISDSSSAGWGGEEMGEELGFRGNGEWKVGEDRSGRGRGGDDGDGSFNNGRREILEGDVGKGNSFDDFLELEVDVRVLVFGGWGVLKLGAYNVSLFGGDIGKDMEEVRRGGDDGGWGVGAVCIEARSGAVTPWTRVIPGVVRTVQVFLDDLVGGGNVDLVSVVDLGPVSNGKDGGDNKGW